MHIPFYSRPDNKLTLCRVVGAGKHDEDYALSASHVRNGLLLPKIYR